MTSDRGPIPRRLRFLRARPTGPLTATWTIWAAVLPLVASCVGGAITRQPSSGMLPTGTAIAAPAHVAARSKIPARSRTTTPARTRPRPRRSSSPAAGAVIRHGVVLPNRRRTPGAVNPAVTPATIAITICRTGWTSTVRPDSGYTSSLKVRQLASGYAYHGDTDPSDYEEDHLISLELGGSPVSTRNLWPEPYRAVAGARAKDQLENKLHDLVCAHALALATAQRAIARNWWHAYRHYIRMPVPRRPDPTHRRSRSPSPLIDHNSCTRTSSGSCIRAGEFCPQADYRHRGEDAAGDALTCTGDREHPHWT